MKQKLAIARVLLHQPDLIFLDEPTSVLTPGEADEILGLLREQVTAGQLSVLMISHKFREVTAFADEITVLRKGKFAGSGRVENLTVEDMAKMMLGEDKKNFDEQIVKKAIKQSPKSILETFNLHGNKDNGLEAITSITFQVFGGEIVGIAGVSGNGQRELVEILAGQRLATQGQISINGQVYRSTRQEMFDHQVFILPEEPLRNACVPGMSVAENMALRTFDRPPQAKGVWLILKAIREMATGLIQTFSVKTPSPETPISNLSGGNVQRAVLARELSSENIKVLIAANPCFGLDFAAVEFIHQQILEARNRGVAVLLVSEDLDELLKLSDRIMVMSEGRLVYESPSESADINTIGQKMAGH
jgi:simple sugar transport system ATP-binding protein